MCTVPAQCATWDQRIKNPLVAVPVQYLVPVRERLCRCGGQPHCLRRAKEGHVKPEGEAMHHAALQDVELQRDFCTNRKSAGLISLRNGRYILSFHNLLA